METFSPKKIYEEKTDPGLDAIFERRKELLRQAAFKRQALVDKIERLEREKRQLEKEQHEGRGTVAAIKALEAVAVAASTYGIMAGGEHLPHTPAHAGKKHPQVKVAAAPQPTKHAPKLEKIAKPTNAPVKSNKTVRPAPAKAVTKPAADSTHTAHAVPEPTPRHHDAVFAVEPSQPPVLKKTAAQDVSPESGPQKFDTVAVPVFTSTPSDLPPAHSDVLKVEDMQPILLQKPQPFDVTFGIKQEFHPYDLPTLPPFSDTATTASPANAPVREFHFEGLPPGTVPRRPDEVEDETIFDLDAADIAKKSTPPPKSGPKPAPKKKTD